MRRPEPRRKAQSGHSRSPSCHARNVRACSGVQCAGVLRTLAGGRESRRGFDRVMPWAVSGLYTSTDPETLELLERIRRSDLTQAHLDTISMTVDQLATGYSSDDPADLLDESTRWLRRLDGLLGGRLTIREHNQLMVAAGWLGLLIGSLSYDLNDRRSAEIIRRFVVGIADDVNHGEIGGWSQELKAWVALSEGDYPTAIIEAQGGRRMAAHSPVAVQLLGHEAEALGRLGRASEARRVLDEMNLARTNMPIPDMPRHHFQLEARKFDKVEMGLLQLLGDDDDAGGMAQRILTESRKPDGTWRQPMLAAKALRPSASKPPTKETSTKR